MSLPMRWLVAAVACVVIEILPPATHFAFIALSLGALAGAIAATFSDIPWLPWAAFVVVSAILMPMLIPLAKFLFSGKTSRPQTQTPLVGETVLVLEPITDAGSGVVKVGDDEWRAVSESGALLKDTQAEVVRLETDHLVVRSKG